MNAYSNEIKTRFFQPKQVDQGEQDPHLREFSHTIGSPELDTQIQLRIGLNADNVIEYARFKVYGDPIVIAACDLLCEKITGKMQPDFASLKIAEILAVPGQLQDKLIWVERAYLGVINDSNR